MNILWGVLMSLIGLFFLLSSSFMRENFIYKLFIAKSRLLWKDKVHIFYQVSGIVLIVLGALWGLGIIWTR